ncbi:MAG: ABC transporter substrate-binding protein [Gemmatimonadota bacterium]
MRRASARTHTASGRFVCALALLTMVSCAVPEPRAPDAPPAPAEPADPVLVAAPISGARQSEASELVARAQSALDAGDAEEALRLAGRVIEEMPAAGVSGRALLIRARAAIEAGEPVTAEEAADRYLTLVPSDHPRVPELRVLRAEAVAEEPDEALLRLAALPRMSDVELADRIVSLSRSVVTLVSDATLETALDTAADDADARPVLEARAAALALDAEDRTASDALARAALAHGASGPDALLAEAVLAGELPEGYVASREVTLAAVFPLEGAPALAAFSSLVLEGIEVAAMTAGDDLEVTLEVMDDGGDPDRTAELIAQLEVAGVGGVVGFLQELALDVAADARSGELPLMSPTARVSGAASGRGVYSLEGVDSIGLHDLARYAASQGYQRVAFIESTSPLSTEEGDLFERELRRFGIPTVGRFRYQEGLTFFEPQLRSARDSLRTAEIAALGLTEDDTLRVETLEPVAVFVPVPPEDVELLAPQITHFGLDTLAIDVLGTTGWSDPEMLRRVDTRHTNRVVASAPIGAGTDSPGYQRFREAFEEHFQRTLVSPVPAVGYDAALLLIEAFRRGARSPDQVRAALEGLEDIEGATGVFSVIDGRVVRRTRVVRIQSGTMNPIPTG